MAYNMDRWRELLPDGWRPSWLPQMPFTDMHQLNLDWIIETVKEWSERLIAFFDEDGAKDLVEDVLEEHPEWTTTVMDKSLNRKKLTDLANEEIDTADGTIAPVYMGDFLLDFNYRHDATVKVGNRFYSFCGPTKGYAIANSTDDGRVRVFDTTTNTELTAMATQIQLGHCNGVAWDGTNFYICPVATYVNGSEQSITDIYVYDSTLVNMSVISCPEIMISCTYDWVQNKLYFIGNSNKLYTYNGSFTEVCTIDMPATASISGGAISRQGLAVYDKIGLISTNYGAVYAFEVETGNIYKSFVKEDVDSTGRFKLGEMEDFNFDEEGHLFCADYINIETVLNNAFITELPIGMTECLQTSYAGYRSAGAHDANINNASVACFHLAANQLRSLNQLNVLADTSLSAVAVSSGADVTEPVSVILTRDVLLGITGSYTVPNITIYNAKLTLRANDAANALTFTADDYAITAIASTVCFEPGGQDINLTINNTRDNTDGNLVYTGSTGSLVMVNRLPDTTQTLKVDRITLKLGNYQNGQKISDSMAVTAQYSATGVTATNNRILVRKYGQTVTILFSITHSSSLGLTGSNVILQLAEEFKPSDNYYFTILGRDAGGWAVSNTTPLVAAIETNGNVGLYGNATDVAGITRLTAAVTYVTNKI